MEDDFSSEVMAEIKRQEFEMERVNMRLGTVFQFRPIGLMAPTDTV